MKEGCLDDDGWLEVKKVTVFIGDQGSGKSTAAKVISTLSWMEKALNRGDIKPDEMNIKSILHHFEYQGIREYFLPETEISYVGMRYVINISRKDEKVSVEDIGSSAYKVPKIMYVPAERNFLSTIRDAFDVKSLPDHLFSFAEELRKAQIKLNMRPVQLPINNYIYEYDEVNDASFVAGKDHRVNLLNASSGFQAVIPLYLVTRNLAKTIKENGDILVRDNMSVRQSLRMKEELAQVIADEKLPEFLKQQRIDEIQSKYINKCFFNIVEEPEQNLFPISQRELLHSLLKFNNYSYANKLLITTHSPYIINYLSLVIQGAYLHTQIAGSDKSTTLMPKLDAIVPLSAMVSAADAVIYEMNESDGSIKKLSAPYGIPSDQNYLNGLLKKGNALFDQLLEIEEEL